MRLFISLRRHDSMRKAKDWFCATRQFEVYEELFDWAKSMEPKWGECFVFLELDLPGIGSVHAKNIDLILAFSDRVAVVEVKNHQKVDTARKALAKSLRQCCLSADLVSAHLAAAVSDQAVRPFLFVPSFESSAIEGLTALQLQSISLVHATIVGGANCRVRPADAKGHPLYLAEAIRSRLAQVPAGDPHRFDGAAQEKLLSLVDRTELHELSNLRLAVRQLLDHSQVQSLAPTPDTYVAGLRPREHDRALELLERQRVVEILGSPGSGKSTFIREILDSLFHLWKRERPVVQLAVTNRHTWHSLLSDLLTLLDSEPKGHETSDQLAAALGLQQAIVWVASYEASAVPLVRELGRLFCEAQSVDCRLVVESTIRAALDDTELCVRLVGLSPAAVRKIVEHATTDYRSGRAAMLLNHQTLSTDLRQSLAAAGILPSARAKRERQNDWLSNSLPDAFEQSVCRWLFAILDGSPVSIDYPILVSLAKHAFRRQLPETTGRALLRANEALILGGVITLDPIRDCRWLGAEYEGTAFYWMHRLRNSEEALRLRETLRVNSDLEAEWMSRAEDLLRERFMDRPHVRALVGAWRGDLEEWCRSSFRTKHDGLERMIEWFDRRESKGRTISGDAEELELLLRLLHQAVCGPKAHSRGVIVENQLAEPPREHYWAWYLFQLLKNIRVLLRDPSGEFVVPNGGADHAAEAHCVYFDIGHEEMSAWIPVIDQILSLDLSPPVRMYALHCGLTCSMHQGLEFFTKEDTHTKLVDWSIELGRLAVSGESRFFLNSASAFNGVLTGTRRDNALAHAVLKWFARTRPVPNGDHELDDEFWNDLG